MKVSIIIPIYKVEQYIERCLFSALNQSCPDIEYVLVNDATPDDSMSIVAKMLAQYPQKNVKIINQPENRGLSAARNTGIKEATGDYVYFLDSDDELPLNAIEILLAEINDKFPDMVIGEIDVVGANRNNYPLLKLKNGDWLENEQIAQTFLSKKWYEMACNKLVKREIFTTNNCYFKEGILHEDNLWSFQLALCARSMAVTNEVTYIYHIHQQSITQSKTQKNIESHYFVLNEIIQMSKENFLFDKFPELVDYLDNQRVFFLKTLLKNSFDKEYIRTQSQKIDRLYEDSIRKKKKRSIAVFLKDIVLNLWIKNKVRHF